MKYIEVEFCLEPLQIYSEILQSDLCDIGFESFMDTFEGFLAYCQEGLYSEKEFKLLIARFIELNPEVDISTKIKEIEQQDWNAEWEKSYPAVLINDFCYVHASFHEPIKEVEYNIEISPKMSFGTAHHPTTFQIIQLLQNEDVRGKDVMDMGSGTGVLAILTKMKGASYVEAIDNDEWAFNNAKENIDRNNSEIVVRYGDADLLDRDYDIFIANINRNILLQDISKYANHIRKNGVLFLSGFYTNDVDMLVEEAGKYGFDLDIQLSKENWAALRLIKNK
ncbi:MAG: 50S ribosomal protein L11 methyltransferase [Bacteroidales bacterium]|jgi:ribosomal protein L11 methyltransferase|nr:50S ribosomal protein L11 methyltransferase [Bacteroidales bacterium]MDD4529092.1 50S ribosomal protein L11 methyltransferase [Bacteroidales bacterium]MDD4829090.1 50S ribosomal protein L11 methyltransferase [Bacteroidales bacterium]